MLCKNGSFPVLYFVPYSAEFVLPLAKMPWIYYTGPYALAPRACTCNRSCNQLVLLLFREASKQAFHCIQQPYPVTSTVVCWWKRLCGEIYFQKSSTIADVSRCNEQDASSQSQGCQRLRLWAGRSDAPQMEKSSGIKRINQTKLSKCHPSFCWVFFLNKSGWL